MERQTASQPHAHGRGAEGLDSPAPRHREASRPGETAGTWIGTPVAGPRRPEAEVQLRRPLRKAASPSNDPGPAAAKGHKSREESPGSRSEDPGERKVDLLTRVLDEVDYGLVLVASDGHVVHANRAAHLECATSQPVALLGDRLVCGTEPDQRSLDAAFAEARGSGQRQLVALAPPGVPSGRGHCGLSVTPLRTGKSSSDADAVLVAFPRSRAAESRSIEAFAREVGLSKREHDVLQCLCEGLRVKQIAIRLDIGDQTVRTYLKGLKSKAGFADRFGMIHHVSRLAPMLGPPRASTAAGPRHAPSGTRSEP